MRFDSEVTVNQVLPAIRSIIARELHSSYGFTQEEIARCLSVTQPAVSQYLNRSRADPEVVEELGNDPQLRVLLEDAASRAAKEQDFIEEVRQAVKTVKDKGILHEEFSDTRKL